MPKEKIYYRMIMTRETTTSSDKVLLAIELTEEQWLNFLKEIAVTAKREGNLENTFSFYV